MAYSSVISNKGQVTVPRAIRIRLGLKEGDKVEFLAQGNYTIMRPIRSQKNPFEGYVGALKGAFPHGIHEVNAWVDGMRRIYDGANHKKDR